VMGPDCPGAGSGGGGGGGKLQLIYQLSNGHFKQSLTAHNAPGIPFVGIRWHSSPTVWPAKLPLN
jgi:hypothetical protein